MNLLLNTPMHSVGYGPNTTPNTTPNNLQNLINQARQNPRGFEEMMKNNYPQAYQQALNIRNGNNPQQVIMNMLQQRGINPGILQMLGIK